MDYWFRVGLIHPLAYESKQKHLKTTFSEFQGSRKPLGRSQKALKAIMASSWYDAFMVSQIELTRFYSLTVYLRGSEWKLLWVLIRSKRPSSCQYSCLYKLRRWSSISLNSFFFFQHREGCSLRRWKLLYSKACRKFKLSITSKA